MQSLEVRNEDNERLERGVCPVGSFFGGSQYLVQLSVMSSPPCYSPGGGRMTWKGKELCGV